MNSEIEHLLLRPLVRELRILLGFLVLLCAILATLGLSGHSIEGLGLFAVLLGLVLGGKRQRVAKFRRFFAEPRTVFWIQVPEAGARGREKILLFDGVLLLLRNQRELAFHLVSGEPAIRTFVPTRRFDETMDFLRKLNPKAVAFSPAAPSHAEEPHAESAETAEPEPHAEGAEGAE